MSSDISVFEGRSPVLDVNVVLAIEFALKLFRLRLPLSMLCSRRSIRARMLERPDFGSSRGLFIEEIGVRIRLNRWGSFPLFFFPALLLWNGMKPE